MRGIKLFRNKGGKIAVIISPSPKNQYKCDVVGNGIVHKDELSYGSFTKDLVETSIQNEEDFKDTQSLLRLLWKLPREIFEYHEYIPGTFIKIDDRVHLIHRREGRNIYCYNLDGKATVNIKTVEDKITFPDWIEVQYMWDNGEY